MTLRILLFGPQAMLANRQEIDLEVPDASLTAAEVISRLAKEVPQLSASLATSRLAINHEFASPEQIVPMNAEIALIGMVSGG